MPGEKNATMIEVVKESFDSVSSYWHNDDKDIADKIGYTAFSVPLGVMAVGMVAAEKIKQSLINDDK